MRQVEPAPPQKRILRHSQVVKKALEEWKRKKKLEVSLLLPSSFLTDKEISEIAKRWEEIKEEKDLEFLGRREGLGEVMEVLRAIPPSPASTSFSKRRSGVEQIPAELIFTFVSVGRKPRSGNPRKRRKRTRRTDPKILQKCGR